jgi:hypothetical protein
MQTHHSLAISLSHFLCACLLYVHISNCASSCFDVFSLRSVAAATEVKKSEHSYLHPPSTYAYALCVLCMYAHPVHIHLTTLSLPPLLLAPLSINDDVQF